MALSVGKAVPDKEINAASASENRPLMFDRPMLASKIDC
jgi:hypothetical protein